MKNNLSIRSTVYPLGYDKNGLSDPKRLTRNFNKWAQYIRASTIPKEATAELFLNKMKSFINL